MADAELVTDITHIGGHRGMMVERYSQSDGRTLIHKRAVHERANQGSKVGVDLYDENVAAVHMEARFLDHLDGCGFTPALLGVGDDWIEQEDVGTNEGPRDMEAWRRNLVRMLAAIRTRGVRHGDLRGNNIITRDDWPWVVDWQDANIIGDVPPQRQPWSDSYLLMQHIEGTLGPDGQCDTPRVARRWRAVLGALGAIANCTLPLQGKTFLDLGCFQGDFVALAASEGMRARGVDTGGFRSGENSLTIGRRLWKDFPFGRIDLFQENIVDLGNYGADVVTMFSTWPYIVKDYGIAMAQTVLSKVVAEAGVFFFETQLAGDGPGPDFLATDGDVAAMLIRCGAQQTKPIGTFPVTGRPASRTVWRVEG